MSMGWTTIRTLTGKCPCGKGKWKAEEQESEYKPDNRWLAESWFAEMFFEPLQLTMEPE
jgi:hypothetical protein